MVSRGGIGAAESLSGSGGLAHVVIAKMVIATARTTPNLNASLFGSCAMSGLLDQMSRAGLGGSSAMPLNRELTMILWTVVAMTFRVSPRGKRSAEGG